ncbi:STAS domain-containing protein [Bacillus sp. V59.32b]|uniref:STAS domain-containing protein n=1 Tax=Bacillus sp. V59.32b TaxID=1758642 RepID=UPI000E3DE710|nr:STAS domain-containing protein [Bacillus sp. V59.32b]RFU66163.1 STAS domain-containing protein [Bacillus sp. V59.32b]
MKSFSAVAKYLTDHAEPLAIKIVDDIIQRLEIEFSKEELEYYYNVYAQFIVLSAEGITLDGYEVPQGFIEMSRKNGERQAQLKGRISSIIGRYPQIRYGLIEQITQVSIEHGLSTEESVAVNKRVNFMLDTTVTETILAFERQTDSVIDEREKEINEKQRAINELSAPIVPIQDGIAILPLIGTFDPERVEHVFDKVIPSIPRLQVNYLIIDFSGILTIDTYVASQLFNVYDVLRLLGISVVFTGIRPDLATKSISTGIDFSAIKTYSNVRQAIEDIR